MEVELVKGFDGERIENKSGKVKRNGQGQFFAYRLVDKLTGLVVISAHKNAPTNILFNNQNVDPGHAILILLISFCRDLDGFIKRWELDGFHINVRINDRLQTNFRP